MSEMTNQLYDLSDDGIKRLIKDLNYMFQHLDDNNVRRLYTEYCDIRSELGETIIDGPLLYMRAKGSSTIRLKAGWDDASSEFVFNLYDQSGAPVIELDSTGNAVMRGSINTEKDIYVGNRIFLGWGGSTVLPTAALSTRGMYIMEPDSTKYMAAIYSTNVQSILGTTYPVYEFEIETSNAMNITAKERMRIYMYAGYDGASTATINTTDRMVIRSFNGKMFINTDHSAHTTDGRGTYIGEDNLAVYLGSYSEYYNVVSAVRDMPRDYRDSMNRYYFAHNQKYMFNPTSDFTRSVTTNVTHQASTKRITSTNNCYIRCSDTTIDTYAEIYSTFASKDLTKFPDGTAATTDDYMVFVFHANSTNVNQTHGVYFQLGADSANYFRYYLTSTNGDDWTTGWNHVWRKIGAYQSVNGAPSLNNIGWSRLGYRAVGDTTVEIVIDYVGIARANPTDDTQYNVFQRTGESGIANVLLSETNSIMRDNNGSPAICQLPINAYDYGDTLWITAAQDFDISVENFSMLGGYAPAISAVYDADNFAIASMSSNVLRINGAIAGSTFGDYINGLAHAAFRNTVIRLARETNKWTASFWITTDPESYREVTYYNGPTTRLAYVDVYLGHSDFDSGTRITNIKFKRYFEY